MSTYTAGGFYPPNPNSRVWKGTGFVDGAPPALIEPAAAGSLGISGVLGLTAALAAKANFSHSHVVSDISPLPLTDVVDGGTFF